MNNCILLRYGEIGLKSKKVRLKFEQQYVHAITEALKRHGIIKFDLKNFGGRFVLFTKEVEAAIIILQKVPGIQSISPSHHLQFKEKEEIFKAITDNYQEKVNNKTFAIRARRIGAHNFTSREIQIEGGSAIYENSNGVNLTNPEIAINLEIRNNDCFLYTEKIQGLGGMSPGSGGKVLLLFSGGIDSPVAALQLLKRGCQVDFLFVNLVGEKSFADVAQVYNFLINNYAYGYSPKFYHVNGKEIVKKITQEVPDNARQLALKVFFYQLATQITEEHVAIATGEALAQKSTQTLKSLAMIQQSTNKLILRPLLTFDKTEITVMARKIGTFAKSEKVKEVCGLAEGKVITMPKLDLLQTLPSFEQNLSICKKTKQEFKGIIPVVEEPPKEKLTKFTTVDMRPKHLQDHSPLKTDEQDPYPFILNNLNKFSKNNSYLLICDFGVQSEEVAFLLRQRGIKAAGVSVKNYLKYFLQERN